MRDLSWEISGLVPESVTVSISKELKITEDVDYEVDHASSSFGYWAVMAEKAETRYQRLKFNFEAWRARVESMASKERSSEGMRAYTESQMKAYVASQAKYKLYMSRLIKFDEDRRVMKVLAKAFEIKAGLIQTKSSNRRNEMKGAR